MCLCRRSFVVVRGVSSPQRLLAASHAWKNSLWSSESLSLPKFGTCVQARLARMHDPSHKSRLCKWDLAVFWNAAAIVRRVPLEAQTDADVESYPQGCYRATLEPRHRAVQWSASPTRSSSCRLGIPGAVPRCR